MARVSVLFSEPKIPQWRRGRCALSDDRRFSALQRAENSSIRYCRRAALYAVGVSVLFSEPKIPQLCRGMARWWATSVSVLFSEPKIPQ